MPTEASFDFIIIGGGQPAAVARKPDGAQQAMERLRMRRKIGELRRRIVEDAIRRRTIGEEAGAGPGASASGPEPVRPHRAVRAEMPPGRTGGRRDRQRARRLLGVEQPAMKSDPANFDHRQSLRSDRNRPRGAEPVKCAKRRHQCERLAEKWGGGALQRSAHRRPVLAKMRDLAVGAVYVARRIIRRKAMVHDRHT